MNHNEANNQAHKSPAEREALRWEQIAATRNGKRYTPQGDPQYDAILAAGDFAGLFVEPHNKPSTLALDKNGDLVHVTTP